MGYWMSRLGKSFSDVCMVGVVGASAGAAFLKKYGGHQFKQLGASIFPDNIELGNSQIPFEAYVPAAAIAASIPAAYVCQTIGTTVGMPIDLITGSLG